MDKKTDQTYSTTGKNIRSIPDLHKSNRSTRKVKEQNVFLLPRFSVYDEKGLEVKLYEKNGGRQVALQVKASEPYRARPPVKIFSVIR